MEWNAAAVALASRVQYEQSLGRSRLIREDFVKVILAETLQSLAGGMLDPEYNHPDLPGTTRIDIALRTHRSRDIFVASELKWVRETTDGVNRNWMTEIVTDILRLERLSAELTQDVERAVVVVGEVPLMADAVWTREANTGAGGRVNVVAGLLQARDPNAIHPADWAAIELRACNTAFRSILRTSAAGFEDSLPTTYLVRLVGYHRAAPNGVEAAIWTVKRPVQRRVTFDSATEWPRPPPATNPAAPP